jgi:hypothetical protein
MAFHSQESVRQNCFLFLAVQLSYVQAMHGQLISHNIKILQWNVNINMVRVVVCMQ